SRGAWRASSARCTCAGGASRCSGSCCSTRSSRACCRSAATPWPSSRHPSQRPPASLAAWSTRRSSACSRSARWWPGRAPRARSSAGRSDPTDELLKADAVVIGSGAGGAPVAARLAAAGLEVVVLEAGARLETRDFDGDEARLLPRLMKATTARDSGMELYAGRCVGGSTVVNDALCWRPPPEILELWRREHGLAGLSDAALAPHVDRVWREIGATPTDRAHLNRNAHRLELGAERLGWAGHAMARNVRGCVNLGLCNLGCPSGAKQSALLTWIPQAERAGARVIPFARAE